MPRGGRESPPSKVTEPLVRPIRFPRTESTVDFPALGASQRKALLGATKALPVRPEQHEDTKLGNVHSKIRNRSDRFLPTIPDGSRKGLL